MAWYTKRYALSDALCNHRVSPLGQNHLHNFLLRAPLLAAHSVNVDIQVMLLWRGASAIARSLRRHRFLRAVSQTYDES
jgi:hypothetical protein